MSAILLKLSPSCELSPLISFFSLARFSSLSSTYFFTFAKAASSSMASFIGTPMATEFVRLLKFVVSSPKSAFWLSLIWLDRFDNLVLSKDVMAFFASAILPFKPSNPFFSSDILLSPFTARPILIPTCALSISFL